MYVFHRSGGTAAVYFTRAIPGRLAGVSVSKGKAVDVLHVKGF